MSRKIDWGDFPLAFCILLNRIAWCVLAITVPVIFLAYIDFRLRSLVVLNTPYVITLAVFDCFFLVLINLVKICLISKRLAEGPSQDEAERIIWQVMLTLNKEQTEKAALIWLKNEKKVNNPHNYQAAMFGNFFIYNNIL